MPNEFLFLGVHSIGEKKLCKQKHVQMKLRPRESNRLAKQSFTAFKFNSNPPCAKRIPFVCTHGNWSSPLNHSFGWRTERQTRWNFVFVQSPSSFRVIWIVIFCPVQNMQVCKYASFNYFLSRETAASNISDPNLCCKYLKKHAVFPVSQAPLPLELCSTFCHRWRACH